MHFRRGFSFILTVPASCCFLQVFVVETLEEKPSLYLHKRQPAVIACHKVYTCTRPSDVSVWSFFAFFDQENPRKMMAGLWGFRLSCKDIGADAAAVVC